MAEVVPEEIDIVAEAQVKHTESKTKVAKAVSNLFPSKGELRMEEDRVTFVSTDRESLRFLKDHFRDRRIRSAARRLLLSNTDEGSLQTQILLNKQAAFAGIAALCDDPSESPLGPIVLRIKSNRLQNLIEWMTFGYDRSETS